jgi:hypothetical protein
MMPNTRADLERLKRLGVNVLLPDGSIAPAADELIALCERLLGERDEALRISGSNWEAAREHDHRARNYHAELIERCEIMERMASGDAMARALWIGSRWAPMVCFPGDNLPRPNETNKEGENG